MSVDSAVLAIWAAVEKSLTPNAARSPRRVLRSLGLSVLLSLLGRPRTPVEHRALSAGQGRVRVRVDVGHALPHVEPFNGCTSRVG